MTLLEEAGKEENAKTIREEDKSNQANLEEGRSKSMMKKGLTGRNSTMVHYIDEVMRKNERDKDKARRACTDMLIRWKRVRRRLNNHARRTTPSLASTNPGRTDFVTRQKVKQTEERDRHCRRYKHCI